MLLWRCDATNAVHVADVAALSFASGAAVAVDPAALISVVVPWLRVFQLEALRDFGSLLLVLCGIDVRKS